MTQASMADSEEERRVAFYAMALVVALRREQKLRKGTRRLVLELRMEAGRDQPFAGLYLDNDPMCPTCGEPGRPLCWCAIHKDHDHSVNYMCRGGHHFWVQDPLGRYRDDRRGRMV